MRNILKLPRDLWKKLRAEKLIERWFVEVRRRNRPTACFVNIQRVERMMELIFHRFNL